MSALTDALVSCTSRLVNASARPVASPALPRPPVGQAVDFHVTGFGRFCGVDDNPTTHLMRNLPEYLMRHPLPPGAVVHSCTVLDTAHHCIPTVTSLHTGTRPAADAPGHPPAARRVVIHFGVASSATCIRLEDRAFNEADFRVPDEAGWQPKTTPILPVVSPDVCLGLSVFTCVSASFVGLIPHFADFRLWSGC